MANDSENFDALRKLLALKRLESPPPGYFDRLPREIHVRLAGAQQRERHREQRPADGPQWVARLFGSMERRPWLVGAFGSGVCAVILGGIFYANRVPEADSTFALESFSAPRANIITPDGSAGPIFGQNTIASTNPLTPIIPQEIPSIIFGTTPWAKSQPASYQAPPR